MSRTPGTPARVASAHDSHDGRSFDATRPGLALTGGLVVLVTAGLVAACGSRGPLDDDGPLDAGGGADVGAVDAAEAATETPDTSVPVDAAPDGGSILGCGTCLVGQCSQGILACVQDPTCQKTFQCVVTTCLSSGTPDAACLVKCAAGDPKGALQIFQIFQCVTGSCGADCNGLLGSLLGGLGGGGLGGGGGGGAGGGGGNPPAPQ